MSSKKTGSGGVDRTLDLKTVTRIPTPTTLRKHTGPVATSTTVGT